VKYDLIIFDFDGTLADSIEWFLGALNELAERHGFHRLSRAEMDALRSETTAVILKRLGVTTAKLPVLALALRKMLARDQHKIHLFEGTESTLRELAARGVTLAVASSNSRDSIQAILGPEAAAVIRHYECGVSLFGKASRLRRILRASGIPPSRALFIGDELRDCDAARKAGLAFGAVGWGYARLEALQARSPEETFARVGEILSKLG
jgi:phosphoglycolate phosphatase